MCHSTTTLFYGLFVTQSSLTFAALAHDKTRGARQFIDLVCLRRASGTLQVEQGSGKLVQELPGELWDQIKDEVIKRAMRDAELEIITKHTCSSCLHAAACTIEACSDEDHEVDADIERWDRWEYPDCDVCSDIVTDNTDVLTDHVEAIKIFLSEHGFALPLETPSKDSEMWVDFNALFAIALPLRGHTRRTKKFPHFACEVPHDLPGPRSATGVLSPSAFNIPSSTGQRFRRFVATYHLIVSTKYHKMAILPPRLPSTTDKEKLSSKAKFHDGATEEEKDKKSSKSKKWHGLELEKPQWRIWTTSESCC